MKAGKGGKEDEEEEEERVQRTVKKMGDIKGVYEKRRMTNKKE